MVYPFEFKKNVRIALAFILIFSVLLALYNALSLAEVFPFFSRNPVVEAISLIFSAVITVTLAFASIGSKYLLDKDALKIYIGFIRIKKIPYNKITNIREYRKSNNLILGYLKGETPQALYIFITQNTYDNFIISLREKNTDIFYDIDSEK